MPQEWQPQSTVARVLVRKEPQHDRRPIHKGFQNLGFETALKKKAARSLAHRLQQSVEGRLAQTAVGSGAGKSMREVADAGVKFEISEMANRNDDTLRLLAVWWRNNGRDADKFHA